MTFLWFGGVSKLPPLSLCKTLITPFCFAALRQLCQQHAFHARHVVSAHQSGVVEVALLRSLFLGEDVAVIGMLAFDFAGTCKFEALTGSGFGFHFRHCSTVFKD